MCRILVLGQKVCFQQMGAVCLRKYFTIATEVGGGMAATGYHTKTRNLARNGDRQVRHEEKDDRSINGNDHFWCV